MIIIPLLISTSFLCLLNFNTPQVEAGTLIPGGSITSDTTWTLANSPYWVENGVIVEKGVTLTIEPGVIVKFRKDLNMHLKIEGNLLANGTSSQMIHFTSNSSTPASKDWGNVWINNTATAVINYCNITYGNVGVGMTYASNVNVTNSTMMYNEQGVYLRSTTNSTIKNNYFYQNKFGIVIEDSDYNNILENNITYSNLWYGLLSWTSNYNRIYHNNFINNVFQADDDGNRNFWNDSYPSGGNYWSNYSPGTPDLYDGSVTPQTTGSPDGICDNQFNIDGDSIDYYPLKYPYPSPPPDNELPTITDVNAIPDPQEVYDFVNISSIVEDNENVQGVWVDISDPNSFPIVNFSMQYHFTDNRYYYLASYDIIGSYDFTIWAVDMNNNWNSSSGSFFMQDTTKPLIINPIAIPNNQDIFGFVNISADITDNYALYNAWVNISYPDGSYLNMTLIRGLGDIFYFNQSYGQTGIYGFTIWVNDTSNNWNFSSGFFSIGDTFLPSIDNVMVIPDPQEVFGDVNISAEIADNDNLFGSWIEITFPDSSSINVTMDKGPGVIFYFLQNYNLIGRYDFIIWANDTNGNWNNSLGWFLIVDSSLPSISSVITIPDVQEVFGEVNISAEVSDNYDLFEVWINITDSYGYSFNVTMDQGAGDEFFLTQIFDIVGIYDFVIWANDTSNNWNFSLNSFTMEDITTPVISSIISNPPIQNILENVNISADITDNYELFGVWLNMSYPGGSSVNLSMNTVSGFNFYINQSYNQIGIYNFTIWANDTSNNWNFEIGSFQIQDPTLPSAQVEVISPYWNNNSIIDIMWTASDNTGLSNITLHYRFSSDNSSWIPWTEYSFNNSVSGTTALGSFQFVANEDGYFEFFVNASDIDNNWEPDPLVAEAIVGLDTSVPSSSMRVSKYWNTLASLLINLQTEESNPSSGIKDVIEYYRFSLDNISWSPWAVYSGDDRDGYYEFYSIATDNAGNMESKNTRDTLYAIDNSPPLANAGEDIEIGPDTVFYFDGSSSSDNFGVIDNYTWTITSNSVILTVLYGLDPVFNFDQIGNYQVTLTVRDRSGNIGQDAITIVVFSDLEAPSFTHSANPEIQEVGGSVNITADVIDNIEVFGVLIQIFDSDNNKIFNISMNRIGLTNNYSYNNLYSNTGNYEYVIWANDTSDNWAFSQGSFVIQDSTPPMASAGEDINTKVEKKVIFDGSDSSDNVGITNYTWNITRNGNLITTLYGMKPDYKFKKEGKYEVVLAVRDASGNIGEDMITVKVEPAESDLCWLIIFIMVIIGLIVLFIIWKRYIKKEPNGNGPETEISTVQQTESEQTAEDEHLDSGEEKENSSEN